ncbi:female sterile (2) ltoPP43 [Cochliomyia hominivorax]
MPAVVRVKRRIDEEPLSAFVLNGKRRRLEEEESATALTHKEELSTLLKFAGTIKEQDDTATSQFARLSKEEAKELVLQKTQKPINATDKLRQEIRQQQHEQRFRVVNCMRTTLMDESTGPNNNAKSKEITIVDIEKHANQDKTVEIPKSNNSATTTITATTNSHLTEASTSTAAAATASTVNLTMPTDSDTGYVYDLYIPDNEQQADYVDLMDDNYLSVRAFDDFIYEDRYNDEDDDEYDSEDSNQENYFGNEYPDEDDDAALNSDRDDLDEDEYEDESTKHLRKGLEKFVFGDDDDEENDLNDSSSDDDGGYYNAYRDPYVHSVDPEEEDFCNDIDSVDVDRYGLAYARYKARILKKSKAKKGSDDDDEENDEDEYRDSYKSGTDEEDDYYHSANESDEYY